MSANIDMAIETEDTTLTPLETIVTGLHDLYGRVNEVHWNLPGANSEFHRLLEKFSFGILKHIDFAAERAVVMGGFVEGSSRVNRSGISNAARKPLSARWLNELADAHRKVTGEVRTAIRGMISSDELRTADVLTDIWRDLDLHVWLLESQIKQLQKKN